MLYRSIALILFSLVYIIGLIGNGLLIFIVFRQKHLRTVPNLLVVSLAFGDFLFVLFCVPFGAVAYALDYYPFSTIYCRFENFIINLSLGVSVFSLLALSADRYKIVSKPFSSHANDPSIKLKLIVIFIWFISILLAMPETIYSGLIVETMTDSNNTNITLIYCFSPNINSLLSDHKFMIIRQILRLIIYYLLPFIFISIFYSLIARTLCQAKDVIYSPNSSLNSFQNDERRSINTTTNNNDNYRNTREIFTNNQIINHDKKTRKQLQTRHKVAKIVLFLSLVFFICWLPKQIHDLYWYIGVLVYSSEWNHFWQINKTFALILTYIYSCINPIALYFLSSTFRHFYKRYLFFWRNLACYSKRYLSTRRRTQEITNIPNDSRRRSSSTNNTITTFYYELNRLKAPKYLQQQSP